MNLIILGKQGTGKGTIGKILAERLGIPHISTGKILRQESKKNTAQGRHVKKLIDKGIVVEDSLSFKIVEKRIQEKDAVKGFVFDGFPRNLNQAETLDEMLSKKGKKIDSVIVLEAPDKELMERITGRIQCIKCGKIYHKKYNPPKREGICDKCGERLVQREDDKDEEAIKHRWKYYEEETRPLVEYYLQQGKLKTVDASGNIEEVAKKAEKSLTD